MKVEMRRQKAFIISLVIELIGILVLMAGVVFVLVRLIDVGCLLLAVGMAVTTIGNILMVGFTFNDNMKKGMIKNGNSWESLFQ